MTWQAHDLTRVPDAVEGEFTTFHWVRMLTGIIGKIYTYTPLQHSMTMAVGSTLLALVIGGSLAWLVVRTDMPGRKLVNQLAVLPYIMPSWTLAQAWLVFFKNRPLVEHREYLSFWWDRRPPVGCRMGRCRSSSAVRCIITPSFSCSFRPR